MGVGVWWWWWGWEREMEGQCLGRRKLGKGRRRSWKVVGNARHTGGKGRGRGRLAQKCCGGGTITTRPIMPAQKQGMMDQHRDKNHQN